MTRIPFCHRGLRAAFGRQLPDDHPIARVFIDRGVRTSAYPTWLDGRYRKVFLNRRVAWAPGRGSDLRRRLIDAGSFVAADAEVQVAASIMQHPEARLVLPDEGSTKNLRVADFLLTAPEQAEIEVRTISPGKDQAEVNRVSEDLATRLGKLPFPGVLARLAIRRVRGSANDLLLDSKAVKNLANAVKHHLTKVDDISSASVVLRADGTAATWDGRSSLHGNLADAQFQSLPGASGLRVITSNRVSSFGKKEAITAIKKKRGRRQRSGALPWVLMLDYVADATFETDAIEDGVKEGVRSSRSLSAVVVQQRRLTGPGIAFDKEHLNIVVESSLFKNQNANHPLPSSLDGLFTTSERIGAGHVGSLHRFLVRLGLL